MKMKKMLKNTLISSSLFKYLSRFKNYFWLAFFVLLFSISACDKPDQTNFRTPLTNDTFGTHSIDTLSLIIRTELMDSVPSSNFTKDIIGCYKDGITGKAVASAYFNFRLPSATIKLPTDTAIIVKSVTLTLRYAGLGNYFGNLTENQTFNVFELTQKLKYDSIVYSTHKASYNQNAIGEWTGSFTKQDSLLKIELSKEFGQKLLSASKNQLSNSDSFQNFFKGLAIIPDGKVFTGAIMYFILNHTQTKLTVYYNDTTVNFPINSYSARFSNFKHDYSGSIAQTQLNNPQKEYSEVLLQPMSGTKVTIKFPYLKHLLDSGLIAIHKAEITFPLDLNSPYKANAPASLLLIKTDSSNNLLSIIDRDESYYGGLLNASKTSYSFIITRYIQQLLKEYLKDPNYIEKYTLTLIVPSDNPISAAPVIIKNKDAAGNKVAKIKIWYSNL